MPKLSLTVLLWTPRARQLIITQVGSERDTPEIALVAIPPPYTKPPQLTAAPPLFRPERPPLTAQKTLQTVLITRPSPPEPAPQLPRQTRLLPIHSLSQKSDGNR